MSGKISLALSALALCVSGAAYLGVGKAPAPQPAPAPAPVAAAAPQGDEIRAYLMENPEVIMEAYAVYEQRQQQQEEARDGELIAANEKEIFDDGYSYVTGNPEGDVTVVEFLDYNCGYCKRAHNEVAKFIEGDGNIRLVVKEFPILGAGSIVAGRAALASAMQEGDDKYGEFYEALIVHRGSHTQETVMEIAGKVGLDTDKLAEDMQSEAISAMVRRTYELAEKLSINGTPAFIVGDEVVRGFVPAERLEALAKAARAG